MSLESELQALTVDDYRTAIGRLAAAGNFEVLIEMGPAIPYSLDLEDQLPSLGSVRQLIAAQISTDNPDIDQDLMQAMTTGIQLALFVIHEAARTKPRTYGDMKFPDNPDEP